MFSASVLAGQTFSTPLGLTAMLVVYTVYPMICKIYDSVDQRISFIATLVFCTLLASDMLVTRLAVARYSERHYMEIPSNSIEIQIDLTFPDDVMERLFPTMLFLKK